LRWPITYVDYIGLDIKLSCRNQETPITLSFCSLRQYLEQPVPFFGKDLWQRR
jgi:hypothetical protein